MATAVRVRTTPKYSCYLRDGFNRLQCIEYYTDSTKTTLVRKVWFAYAIDGRLSSINVRDNNDVSLTLKSLTRDSEGKVTDITIT